MRYNLGMTSLSGNDKLRTFANILRLERQQGFRDRAVIGGLDAYLRRWRDELQPTANLSGSYAEMSVEQRRRWAEATLSGIGGQISGDRRQESENTSKKIQSRQTDARPSARLKASRNKEQARKSPSRNVDSTPVKLSDDVSESFQAHALSGNRNRASPRSLTPSGPLEPKAIRSYQTSISVPALKERLVDHRRLFA